MSEVCQDEALRRIVRQVALYPNQSVYQIAKELKIDHVKVLRKIEQYKLAEEAFLTIAVGKRGAKQSCLTFKGLIYALNIRAISPENAADVRLNSVPDVQLMKEPSVPEFREPNAIPDEIQELLPYSMLQEIEKLRSQAKPELELLYSRIEQIDSKARKKGSVIRMFVMLERKFSKRIYGELLKRVNINYYDDKYAKYVFQAEYQRCSMEFFRQVMQGDKTAIYEMSHCLSDPYSLEILQKAYFPFLAKSIPDSKTSHILSWYSTLTAEQLKNELRSFGQGISKLKKIMKRL